jgi:hypothetical protein
MDEIRLGVERIYDIPTSADKLTIKHEWGDIVFDGAVSGTEYLFTPDSIGVHVFIWRDGEQILETNYYSVYAPVIDSLKLFDIYQELEDAEEELFDFIEQVVRGIIENYTGQRFGPFIDKALEIQGDGGDSLDLPINLLALNSILNNYGDDITDLVEIYPNNNRILQRNSRFRGAHYYEIKRDLDWNAYHIFNERYIFRINGNWGWPYVPPKVSQAASLLLNDFLGGNEVAEMRKQGVFEAQLGDFKLRLNADQWGTTGNIQADSLLADYVAMGFGLI